MPWWLPALAVINTGVLCLWYLLHLVSKVKGIRSDHPPYDPGPTYIQSEHNKKYPYDQI